jgi:NADPH:quinone reductase-like Zn-dependent oxidoreductase
MTGVVSDRAALGGLRLASVPRPTLAADQALIRVANVSLNAGEVRGALSAEDGFRPGWDFAGVVAEPAADGGGPPLGARVAGFTFGGAWAEYVAASAPWLAVVPAAVSLADASTLPAAGGTARAALGMGPRREGRKVLVTGASGGVGVFAVQLGALRGDVVTAAIRNPDNEALMRDLGAHNVAVGSDLAGAEVYGPYDLVVEMVGGETFTTALSLLAPGGTCVAVGGAAGPTAFDRSKIAAGASIYALAMIYEWQSEAASVGFAELLEQVRQGALRTVIGRRGELADIADIAIDYVQRRFAGKAVVDVAGSNAASAAG